eukprot:CAMPEP_0113688702 /NCGR_PEP_ID=MMETSP0038_2-20120614/16690_1 /TAXON_ID=2898 /ORGANISM="Cryptomonas paramecium" /LENGTH=198 /DNA_ID=CAMNT_0000609561 /DNA_START=230 /DNA_END=823 /DNA_ORIENTATION=+ /assembly_acc=CAM_ASM_000170
MKRSISLSELRESLGQENDYGGASMGGGNVLRKTRSVENLNALGGRLIPASGAGSRAPILSEKELRDHFNMPLNEVAKKFGMCTTALKKLCRKYGVMQWPHRKLRSLEKKIASLRAEQRYSTTDGQTQLDEEIRKLETQREGLVAGTVDAGPDDSLGGPWSPGGDDFGMGKEETMMSGLQDGFLERGGGGGGGFYGTS